jgi:predicted DCC family thiol-disulfide oxidoreductase YuxK
MTRDATGAQALAGLLQDHGLILLYDGVCGFCDGFVQFVLRHDRTGAMRFATLQGPIGQAALRELPQLADVDSVILLHRGGAWARSTAALEVARYLGGIWRVALLGYAVPRVIRDGVYDWFARHRYRWFGRFDACPIPTPATRQRFLDPPGG